MIEVIKRNQVATVAINRPEKHNAFDDITIQMLTDAFIEIDQDDSILVMVLAGRGKNFSAGGDLEWMKRMVDYSYEENLADASKLASMLNTLNTMSKPTIARVQGAVYGGAVGLVSCCDIAIASNDASFCLSEVKIGLVPATIAPYVINAIGERAARRYFLSAEPFNSTTALKLGLINETCDEEELDSMVLGIVNTLLKNSPAAISLAKSLIHHVSNSPLNNELIEQTSEHIAKVRTSKEGQEGLAAFLEKRSPSWVQTINENESNISNDFSVKNASSQDKGKN